MEGRVAYERAVASARLGGASFKREWRESCKQAHTGWQYMLWDKKNSLKFLQKHYPWFVQTWATYPTAEIQELALLPFLLHAFGGLYVSLDSECLRPSTNFVAGYDIVLQTDVKNGSLISTAQAASLVGHPFWKSVMLHSMQELDRLRLSEALEVTDMIVLGRQIFTAAFKSYMGDELPEGTLKGERLLPRTTVRVFGLGQWFVPCQAGDEDCEDDVSARVAGRHAPASLAGWLHYDNSLRPFRSQRDIGAGGGMLGEKVLGGHALGARAWDARMQTSRKGLMH
ncbi:g8990 [Coccomyxa elongata]